MQIVPTMAAATAPLDESVRIRRAMSAATMAPIAPAINRAASSVNCDYLVPVTNPDARVVSCLKAIRAAVSLPSPPTN
jgi:hypothetical protein